MSDTLPVSGAPEPDRARRWVGPALLVSLTINLFLVCLIAAGFLFHPPRPEGEFGPVPPPFFRMLHRGASDLPSDDRAAIREIMIGEFPVMRPYFVKIEAARKDLADAIGVSPYDREKVKAAFAKVDAAQAEMVKATREAMIDGFGKMKADRRARIAEMMRQQADRRLQRGDHPPRMPVRFGPPPQPVAGQVPAPKGEPGLPQGPMPPDDMPPMVSDSLGIGGPPPPPPPPGGMPPSAPATGLGFTGGAAPAPSGPVQFNGRP